MSPMKISSVMMAMLLGAGVGSGATQSPNSNIPVDSAQASSTDVPADPAQPPITGAPIKAADTRAEPAASPADSDPAMILSDFQQLDADKSGTLSSTEAAKDVDLKDVFKQFDTDANLMLTLAEFRAFAAGKQATDKPAGEPEGTQ